MTLPSVTLCRRDKARLFTTAVAAMNKERVDMGASMLLSEIERATIVGNDALAADVVAMNSVVEIHDDISDTTRRVRLVYPDGISGDARSVSVLSPLGAALLGLREGDSIGWCTATGDQNRFTVRHVTPSAE